MGYPLLKMSKTKLILSISFWCLGIGCLIVAPNSLTLSSPLSYYEYTPVSELKTFVNLSGHPPGKAVPILLYHGVITKIDSANTEVHFFIEQMEMLKRKGYQTITIQQLDDFLQGKFILPPKPIIITFDDGRRDSYYYSDNILKTLGFCATMFEVSGKANDHDNFFLSWEELQKMKASGRWDIEAHGVYSHIRIPIDAGGTAGRFLTSRIYTPDKGLETVSDFQTRVESDYRQNISDLKRKLNVEAKYFSIPMSDFGLQPISNYPESLSFNEKLIKKYFRLAFIQANDSERIFQFTYPCYNYQDADPYQLMRIQVKNMTAADLEKILEDQSPKPPQLLIRFDQPFDRSQIRLAYGIIDFNEAGLHLLSTREIPSTRVEFGDSHWDNYIVQADVGRTKECSLILLAYIQDKKTYLSFGLTKNHYFLHESIGGIETQLDKKVSWYIGKKKKVTLKIKINNGLVTTFFNNKVIFKNVPTRLNGGKAGFRVWSRNGNEEGILSSISLNAVPLKNQDAFVKENCQ